MSVKTSYGKVYCDSSWGAEHVEVNTDDSSNKITACHVRVSDVKAIAVELARDVLDTSWVMSLDSTAKRAYSFTVKETSEELAEVFRTVVDSEVSAKFGEMMVSMGAARALEIIFQHIKLPVSELWKPKRSQNEGFDFHTVCQNQYINFGEAKFSQSDTPHNLASAQGNRFFSEEKHYRDGPHLEKLTSTSAFSNFSNDKFGMIVAFSMNHEDPLRAFENACAYAEKLPIYDSLTQIYVVGVSN